MTRYELTTIVANDATTNPAPDLLAKHGGSIIREDEIGQRRFAYPIGQLTAGIYTRFLFEMEPSSVQPLDAALRRDGTLVRHLLVLEGRASVTPAPAKVDMSDADIAALGDVKEMQAADALLRSKKGATEGQAPVKESVMEEITAEEVVEETPALVAAQAADVDEAPAADERPAEDVTAADHAAVKDESGVDEATRQAALDKKLKSILGK